MYTEPHCNSWAIRCAVAKFCVNTPPARPNSLLFER
uniref:Uncharacterized protein n=1 Tax=Schistosoma japonicum TaxID=6182 RepID=Q5BYU0_SCHJA|nr:unknown [Schistosoma japonicum]